MDGGAMPPWTHHLQQPPSSSSFSFSSNSSYASSLASGAEEEDICRVCREATPDMPLLHPCKCSGSIKFVHQECLLQWIKTKKVTKCELCKYPFKLSKVYHPQMPSRVPHRLFLQRLFLQLQNNVLIYLRFVLVCFIWLGLVPFLARWIWRFYFRFGDWSAHAPSTQTQPPADGEPSDATEPSGFWEDGFFGWLKGHDFWTAVLRDCFQGQIITICLVAVFVIVFLIREWVMQNAVAVVEEFPAPVAIPAVHQPDANQDRSQQDGPGRNEQERIDDFVDVFGEERQFEAEQQNLALADSEPHNNLDPLPPVVDNPPAPVPNQPLDLPENPNPRLQDEEDDDLDADDFDGLWDILGMQGPIIGLLHNTVFSALMIALAVGLGVWLPFMFGKTALGALSHPVEVLVQHPLTLARMAVDICLDGGIFVLCGTLLTIHQTIRHFLRPLKVIIPRLSVFIDYLDKRALAMNYLSLTQSAGKRILQTFNGTSSETDLSFLDHPFLADFKQTLTEYTTFPSLRGTITEKVIAVIAGYIIFTLLGAFYLRLRKLRDPTDDNPERLIRDILRQAGAVLKVVVIIAIELVAFPIFCGILLDLSCLPLFSEATIASRWEFAKRSTFTATFLHWFTGTLYMFHFAMFVSMCRELVRPGTLYFIRDPNDPQFHPIREILERPTLHQLRKIGVSGVIYAFLILICFGLVIKLVDLTGGVLPLRISSLEPMFEVPVDLLLSHIALPLTAHFVKPSAVVKAVWKWWFNVIARTLRLSSFLFGTQVPDEEGSIQFREILRIKRRPTLEEVSEGTFRPNGSFLRVPATDTIPLHRRKQMLIPVTVDNIRLDGQEETEEQRNDRDFRVVYVPPHFSTRITLLFVWMWIFAVAMGLSVTVVPLLLGRRMFTTFFGAETRMHDIYAYGIGLYTLIATVLLTEFAVEKTSLLTRSETRSFKHALQIAGIRLAKWIYLIIVAGAVLPLLCGACLDLYLMIPFKRVVSPGTKIEMALLQDWAFGVIHLKIAGRIILYLENRHTQQLRNIFRGHWTDPNIRLATKKFIIPIFNVGTVALVIPLILAYASENIRDFFGWNTEDKEERMARHLATYPIFLVFVTVVAGIIFAKRAIDNWRDSVRDEIYLVGEVLHNLDESER